MSYHRSGARRTYDGRCVSGPLTSLLAVTLAAVLAVGGCGSDQPESAPLAPAAASTPARRPRQRDGRRRHPPRLRRRRPPRHRGTRGRHKVGALAPSTRPRGPTAAEAHLLAAEELPALAGELDRADGRGRGPDRRRLPEDRARHDRRPGVGAADLHRRRRHGASRWSPGSPTPARPGAPTRCSRPGARTARSGSAPPARASARSRRSWCRSAPARATARRYRKRAVRPRHPAHRRLPDRGRDHRRRPALPGQLGAGPVAVRRIARTFSR